jgi:hypothetical protein
MLSGPFIVGTSGSARGIVIDGKSTSETVMRADSIGVWQREFTERQKEKWNDQDKSGLLILFENQNQTLLT